jgi:hypothetical protein
MGGFGLWHCRKLQAELSALMRGRSCTVLTVCLMGPCKGDTELQETSIMNYVYNRITIGVRTYKIS